MPASAKYVFVILLFIPWLILHEYSPPGFYVEEAAGAAHAICLNSSLTDYNGVRVPLLAESLGGGYTTPTYMYPLALWARVFGHSIFSLRWFSTFLVLLTIVFTCFVARNHGFEKGNISVLLIAAVCPWAFHLSRMAWDPPMAPMFLMGSVYFISLPASIRNTVLGSILAVLAMYAYPPFRVAVPLFYLGVMVYQKWPLRKIGWFSAIAILLALPLIEQTVSGEIQGRFNRLSVFGDFASNPVAGQSIAIKLIYFIKNIFLHFDPRYLFLFGDQNLRHSPSVSGQLSYFSAVVVILFIAGYFVHNRKSAGYAYIGADGREVFTLALWGIFCCTMPAALTWQGTPHALRSIGAWPFYVLLFALMLTRLLKWVPPWALCVSIMMQFSFFHWNYFSSFPDVAGRWYDQQLVDEANNNSAAFRLARYPEIAKFYHRVRLDRLTPDRIKNICTKAQ
jgi:hypothetical protein